MKRIWLISILVIVAMLATACNVFEEAAEDAAAAVPVEEVETVAEEAMEDAAEEVMEIEEAAEEMVEEAGEAMEEEMADGEHSDEMMEEVVEAAVEYNGQDWTSLQLTNAQTGETFTFADFAGKTVYVHSMATWCGNCRASQRSLRDNVVPQVSGDDVVFVSLSVETNISPEDLAVYASNESFGWTFAVMSPEMLAALSQQFGRTVATPPSQPHFIIRPDGATTDLLTGNPSPDSVIQSLQS